MISYSMMLLQQASSPAEKEQIRSLLQEAILSQISTRQGERSACEQNRVLSGQVPGIQEPMAFMPEDTKVDEPCSACPLNLEKPPEEVQQQPTGKRCNTVFLLHSQPFLRQTGSDAFQPSPNAEISMVAKVFHVNIQFGCNLGTSPTAHVLLRNLI